MKYGVLLVLLAAVLVMAASGAFAQTYTATLSLQNSSAWTWKTHSGGLGTWYANDVQSGTTAAIWTLPTIPFGLYSVSAYVGWYATCTWVTYQVQSAYPYDAGIPWNGQYGTNGQWLGTNQNNDLYWTALGAGPQAPASSDFNAPGNGMYMWMGGAYNTIYTKFDYSFYTGGTLVGATPDGLKVTAVYIPPTTPEPSSFLALLAGLPVLVLLRRKH